MQKFYKGGRTRGKRGGTMLKNRFGNFRGGEIDTRGAGVPLNTRLQVF